jgi:hypothetical protein
MMALLSVSVAQIAHAAAPLVSPNVQQYLYDYDHYAPPGWPTLGGFLNSNNSQCYNYDTNYNDGTYPPPPASNVPVGTAYLGAIRPWISVAGPGNEGTVSLTVGPGTTVPIKLQINLVNMACQLVSKGVYYPSDTTLNDSNWFNVGEAVPYKSAEVVTNLGVAGGLGTASFTGGGASQTQIAQYANSKYWSGNPIGIDYTPPGGNFNSFNPNQVITVTGNSQEINEFHNSDGTYNYSCVSGDLAGHPDSYPASTVDSWVGGISAFVSSHCFVDTTALNFPFTFVVPNNANCASITAPSQVQAENTIGVKFSMNNPTNSATWNTATVSGGKATSPGVSYGVSFGLIPGDPSYTTAPGVTQYALFPTTVLATATMGPINLNFTAPVNPDAAEDIYGGTVQMYYTDPATNVTSAFGTPCTWTTQVHRYFKYIPTIGATATPAATPTSILPADSALVKPGAIINLTANVKNTALTDYPGDKYQWTIEGFQGQYIYSAGATTIHFAPIGGAPTVVMANGSSTGNIYGTNAPAGKPSSLPVGTATYTVPAGTPDGTQYCFQASITPQARSGGGAGGQSTTAYQSYSYAGGGTPSGAGINYTTAYENANSPFFTNSTNYQNYTIPAGTTLPTNLECFEVENVRSLDLNVSQGDVHAGGDLYNLGGTCSLNANQLYGGVFKDTAGSYSQYVSSAFSSIVGVSTGIAGTNSLTLGNDTVRGNGFYGVVCRPDMVKAANNYIATHHNGACPPLNVSCLNNSGGDIDVGTLSSGIYLVFGSSINIYGTVHSPITIFAPDANLGWGVNVVGDITYDPNVTSINALPSFGVIQQGGSININKAVKNLSGFYVAQTYVDPLSNIGTGGIINTCTEHTSGSTNDCPNTLNIYGSLTANQIKFNRTGVNSLTGGTVVTENVVQSPVLYLSPPPAFATAPNTAASLPQYDGEGLPIY